MSDHAHVWWEEPTGSVDDINTDFAPSQSFRTGSLRVTVNGVELFRGGGFTETETGVSIDPAPRVGDAVRLAYEVAT